MKRSVKVVINWYSPLEVPNVRLRVLLDNGRFAVKELFPDEWGELFTDPDMLDEWWLHLERMALREEA